MIPKIILILGMLLIAISAGYLLNSAAWGCLIFGIGLVIYGFCVCMTDFLEDA